MQYVAAVSGKGWEVDRVKEQLLQSNPVLEGEWNSKSDIELLNVSAYMLQYKHVGLLF